MSYKSNKYHTRRQWQKAHRAQQARYRKRTGSNKYERRRYTEEEDYLIVHAKSKTDREIAKQLSRSVSSVQGRRFRLKHKDYLNRIEKNTKKEARNVTRKAADDAIKEKVKRTTKKAIKEKSKNTIDLFSNPFKL